MTKGKTFRERVHLAGQHVRFLTVEEAKEIMNAEVQQSSMWAKHGNLQNEAQFRAPRTFPEANSTSGLTRSCRAATRHFRTARRKSS
jgi:hypothetical protein